MLSFGDKPAPVNAQIALRKTEQERKRSQSKEAKAILENSYMDDICDSVDTVEDARRQTNHFDKVLEKRGFVVKGWTSNKVLKKESQSKK